MSQRLQWRAMKSDSCCHNSHKGHRFICITSSLPLSGQAQLIWGLSRLEGEQEWADHRMSGGHTKRGEFHLWAATQHATEWGKTANYKNPCPFHEPH